MLLRHSAARVPRPSSWSSRRQPFRDGTTPARRRRVASNAATSGDILYNLTQDVDALVACQLAGVTPLTYVLVTSAGLVTSLSPCTLSVLPLTIGYIAGYSSGDDGASKPNVAVQAVAYSAGLASMLAALGLGAALLGGAYGQIGSGLPLAVSMIAIVMGLNLLQVVQLRLPTVDVDARQLPVAPPLQAYAAGAAFALAASPCSTPVLATLLAYVSSTGNPVEGAQLLLAYTTGYVAPLLLAASFTGVVKDLLAVRQYSAWVTPASGVLLVAGGTYSLLSRVIPA